MSRVISETGRQPIINKSDSSLKKISRFLYTRWVLYIISIVAFLSIWDIAVVLNIVKLTPRPIEVVKELINLANTPLAGHTLWGHIWFSTRRVLIAFLISAGIGIPIGVLMAVNRYGYAIIKPIFELFKPMPPIAWISVAILWFGIGETSKVFIIIIGALVPLIINSYNGIRLVDPELYDCIRILGANSFQEHKEVTFPASFPAIFAGLQVSLSMAWGCVLAAELVGSREGMGFLIVKGMNVSNPALIIAGMVVIAVTAFLSTTLVSYVERWVCPWKRELE